jgi:hypothetical protein
MGVGRVWKGAGDWDKERSAVPCTSRASLTPPAQVHYGMRRSYSDVRNTAERRYGSKQKGWVWMTTNATTGADC